jgi:hypothetical protein
MEVRAVEIKKKREYATREGGRGKNRNKDREGERCTKKRGKGRVSRFIPFLVMYSKAVSTPREYQWERLGQSQR